MRKSTKAIAIVAASVLLAGVGTAAFAYWTAEGSGGGQATTSSNSPALISVVQTSTVQDLAPGSDPQVLSGNFDNIGDGPGYVGSVVAEITDVEIMSGNIAGPCTIDDYVLQGANMPVNQDIAVGQGVGSWSGASISFVNSAANQDGCRGATVTISYTIN